MSYNKQNFTSGQVLKAEHLNHMETGIDNAIEKPETASVGQMLIVEEIDENGKPTKFKTINIEKELPEVTSNDNGKFARVVNGKWATDTISNAEGVTFG